MPLSAAAATMPIPTVGLTSTALSTKSSVEMKPSVPGNPTLASPVSRKQTARVGECSYRPWKPVSESRPKRDSTARSVRPKPASERITENQRHSDAVSDMTVSSSSPTSTSEAWLRNRCA